MPHGGLSCFRVRLKGDHAIKVGDMLQVAEPQALVRGVGALGLMLRAVTIHDRICSTGGRECPRWRSRLVSTVTIRRKRCDRSCQAIQDHQRDQGQLFQKHFINSLGLKGPLFNPSCGCDAPAGHEFRPA